MLEAISITWIQSSIRTYLHSVTTCAIYCPQRKSFEYCGWKEIKPKKVSFNTTGKEIIVSNPQIDNDSDSVESISTDLRDDCPKRTVTDDDVSPVEEIGSNKQNKKQKTFLFEEVNDEFYISSSDEETLTDGNNEIKIDLIEEQDNQIQMPIVKGDFKRWWEKIPKHLYSLQ